MQSDSKDVQNFRYTRNLVQHPQVEIGEYTAGPIAIYYMPQGYKVKIGNFCSLGPSTTIFMGSEHNIKAVSTYAFAKLRSDYPKAAVNDYNECRGNVTIGNDVWIGEGTLILSGITIGDGAIIGARSVVSKNVEPYSIVAGSPLKFIRKRFDDKTIEKLLQIKWWDWPIEKIRDNADLISGTDIEVFIERSLELQE